MVNPREIDPADRPLRFVAFGESLISDLSNPVATSARAILSALAGAGHEVTFFERRGNDAYLTLLKRFGAGGMRGFAGRYQGIQVRTYDLPRGWERTVWVGREAGTADAIFALPGTPTELLAEIAALPPTYIVPFIDESFGSIHSGYRLVRSPAHDGPGSIPFGPAVTLTPPTPEREHRPIIVAYDDIEEAEKTAHLCVHLEPLLVSCGLACLPGWQRLPEYELQVLYGTHSTAIITGAGESPWAHARVLLPQAHGCAVLTPTELVALRSPANQPQAMQVPIQFDAAQQAHRIITVTRAALVRS